MSVAAGVDLPRKGRYGLIDRRLLLERL